MLPTLRRLLFAAVIVCVGCSIVCATDLTLFVISDTHFTSKSLPSGVKVCIQAMNGLPGTAYPPTVGGMVSMPAAVVTCGDLCDGGAGIPATDTPKWYSPRNYQDQWYGYDYYFPRYGVSGSTTRIRYQNYATGGNHDFYNNFGTALSGKSWYVAGKLAARYNPSCNITNGNVYYSFDIDGVHVVSLGRWTDSYVLSWLAGDLAALPQGTPVVLFLHYAFNDGEVWYTDAERQMLANVIAGYRVIAILHGHTHKSTHYQWKGYDVYDDGASAENREFGVLHITDTTLSYAQYQTTTDKRGNWSGGYWKWAHIKPY